MGRGRYTDNNRVCSSYFKKSNSCFNAVLYIPNHCPAVVEQKQFQWFAL